MSRISYAVAGTAHKKAKERPAALNDPHTALPDQTMDESRTKYESWPGYEQALPFIWSDCGFWGGGT